MENTAPILKGFRLFSVFSCLFIFFPMIIHELFVIGVEGIPLVVAIITICCILLFHTTHNASPRASRFLQVALSMGAGSILCLASLLDYLEFDSRSIPTVFVLSLILVLAYGVMFVEMHVAEPGNEEESDPGVQKRAIPSLLVAFMAIAVPSLVLQSSHWFFLILGTYYLVFPLLALQDVVPARRERPSRAPAKECTGRASCLIANYLVLAVAVLVFCSAAFTYDTVHRDWFLVGFGAGSIGYLVHILYHAPGSQKSIVPFVLGTEGIMILFALLIIDWHVMLTPYYILADGFIAGFIGLDTIITLKTYPVTKTLGKITHVLVLALVMGVAGFAASMFRWVIRDEIEMLPVILVSIIGAMALALVLRSGGKRLWKETRAMQAPPAVAMAPAFPGRKARRVIALIVLTSLVANPAMLGILHGNSRLSIVMELPATMYTLDGTPVNSITLGARTGTILLYDPPATHVNSTQPSFPGEYIRYGKSIRLGAYFYGMYDITSAEAIEWIGENVDVFAAGGWCGLHLMPENVSDLKALNPALRFYPMVFATTYWEDPKNNITTTGGNLTIPYSWGIAWNETMHAMTLKAKDGSEAIGLQHGSPASQNHIMDLGNPDWADFFAWFFTQRVHEFHADGLAVDEVMWDGYWGTSYADLRDYSSDEEVRATCYQWLERVDKKTDVQIITQAFWDEAQQYQQGIWGEIAFRCGGQYGGRVDDRSQTVFYEPMTWMEIVGNMDAVASQNKSYIWAAWYERDDPDALEYAVATYLMGKPNNCTWLVFHPQPVYDGGYPANVAGYSIRTVMDEVEAHPEYFNLELGQALGEMHLVEATGGQAWQRDYERGIIVVNPYHACLPGFDSTTFILAPSH